MEEGGQSISRVGLEVPVGVMDCPCLSWPCPGVRSHVMILPMHQHLGMMDGSQVCLS